MKVEFKNWIIHSILAPLSWSKWCDIQTFMFGSTCYLLQGKLNKVTNSKKFKVTQLKQNFQTANIGLISLEKLKDHGLIEEQIQYNTIENGNR